MKSKVIAITSFIIGLLFVVTPILANDELIGLEPLIPGRVEGTGTYFEIKDDEYLNIVLKSTEEITILLESVFKTISLNVKASISNSSTMLTIEGLEPNKTYHKYEDSYKNEAVFVSEESGSYSWTQDLTKSHHVWMQDLTESRYILTQEATGTIFLPEQCSSYGTWDAITSTCTLSQDLTKTIEITTNGITLDCLGYSITGTGNGYGIYLNSKNGVTIKNCNIAHFAHGISLQSSYGNTFINNTVSDNRGAGIYLYYSDGNVFISNTSLSNGNQGIILNSSNDNAFTGNNVLNGNLFGLYLSASSDNTLTNNTIAGNPYNFYLFGTILGPGVYTRVGLQNYIDTTNTVDGKPIYYIIGATDQIYDGSTNAGIFYCIDCNNVTIKDLTIQKTAHGIFLWNTNDSTIEHVTTSNIGYGGVDIYYSDRNTITNVRGSNNGYGIAGLHSSSDYNTIYNNTSQNSWAGIYLYRSNNNNVYHNNLIDNTRQISNSYGVGNLFDDGYPSGGNYFNNYTGLDLYSGLNQDQPGSDGIGDTPYTFYGGQDRYPFMVENGWGAPISEKMIKPVGGYLKAAYGDRRDPFSGELKFHNGIDIVSLVPEEIYGKEFVAPVNGKVVNAGFDICAEEWMRINHEDVIRLDGVVRSNVATKYFHLKTTFKDVEEPVTKNRTIGEVGGLFCQGWSTAPHLHFSIYEDAKSVNPLRYVNYVPRPGKGLRITVLSPVDLVITDPGGFTVSKQLIEISETVTYLEEDSDGNETLDDIIWITDRKTGDYLITVIPEPSTLLTDVYTLEALANETTVILAENVPISDIPRVPYILRLTGTEIIPIIPGFIDFNPDTFNLKSRGKYVTVYIELSRGFDIGDINLESVRLNGEVRAESKPTEVGDYDDNGIPDLMIKFDRAAIQAILEEGEEIEITITGKLTDGRLFQGSDIIKVISRDYRGALALVFLLSIAFGGLFIYRRKLIFLSNNKGAVIIVAFLIGSLIFGSIFGYQWWRTKGKLTEKTNQIESVISQLIDQKNQIKDLEKQMELLGISKVSDERFSFRYYDDTWQFKKESPTGWYIDGQLIHGKLKKCNAWLGMSGIEMCMPGEEDCEAVFEGKEEIIELNDGDSIQRKMWTVKKAQTEYILMRYDIFEGTVPFYGIELYTTLNDRQQCVNDFETVLKTFEFRRKGI